MEFHDFTIARHGGMAGFRDEGLLSLAVARPWMSAGGDLPFKTPFEKAAAIAESIVRNHPFNDGNHRTALAAAHLMLRLYEIKIQASTEDQRDAILKLELGEKALADFAIWLEQNSILEES